MTQGQLRTGRRKITQAFIMNPPFLLARVIQEPARLCVRKFVFPEISSSPSTKDVEAHRRRWPLPCAVSTLPEDVCTASQQSQSRPEGLAWSPEPHPPAPAQRAHYLLPAFPKFNFGLELGTLITWPLLVKTSSLQLPWNDQNLKLETFSFPIPFRGCLHSSLIGEEE